MAFSLVGPQDNSPRAGSRLVVTKDRHRVIEGERRGDHRMRSVIAVFLLAGASTAWAQDEDWPQFRGPGGLGLTTERNLPLHWGGEKAENVAWKAPLVGEGHASPIVSGSRVFVCTVRWPGGKPDAAVVPEHHVLAYSATEGKVLWDTLVDPGPWKRD